MFESDRAIVERPRKVRACVASNRLLPSDRAGHEWYRFVLSYPPHLVRQYLERFNVGVGQIVLDPFCGTGTTLVECKKLSIGSLGIEANPMAHFASAVKTQWGVSGRQLLALAQKIAESTNTDLAAQGYPDDAEAPLFDVARRVKRHSTLLTLDEPQFKLLLRASISPIPLHKTLVLLEKIHKLAPAPLVDYCRLALARALVEATGNLHFGPEVGVGKPKADAAVVREWFTRVAAIAIDLDGLRQIPPAVSRVLAGDARAIPDGLEPGGIDAVITSPPYPNEKDYTRTTRLESVILGFIKDKADLRRLKQSLVRSNTRNVYCGDDDHHWVESHREIQKIAAEIEKRRLEQGKTSGFERMYATVARSYFGGMARHFENLKPWLRPGARLAYVVGDQASYLRVMIRTGEILADIAESRGYRVKGIDLFRTRLATATGEQLREEVVLLEWPGVGKKGSASR